MENKDGHRQGEGTAGARGVLQEGRGAALQPTGEAGLHYNVL